MKQTCKIRYATDSDKYSLLDLVEQFCQEYGSLEYDLDSVEKSYELIKDKGFIIVAEMEGSLVGFITGLIAPSLFNFKHVQCQELAWFVHKDFRKDKIGEELLRSFEDVCRERGANWIVMVAPESLKVKQLDTFYRLNGYKKKETSYLKEI